ncbi:MAG: hypothetical protein ACXAEN_14855 [Candidatus Thorarchaeota archaeon]|jgi:uncharacterized protein YlaN (UPF0358 family)
MVQIAGVGSFSASDFDAELQTALQLNREAQATARQIAAGTVQLASQQFDLSFRRQALGLERERFGAREPILQAAAAEAERREKALQTLTKRETAFAEDLVPGGVGPPGPLTAEEQRDVFQTLPADLRFSLAREQTQLKALEAGIKKVEAETEAVAGREEREAEREPEVRRGMTAQVDTALQALEERKSLAPVTLETAQTQLQVLKETAERAGELTEENVRRAQLQNDRLAQDIMLSNLLSGPQKDLLIAQLENTRERTLAVRSGVGLAERAGVREEELFPFQKQLAQARLTAELDAIAREREKAPLTIELLDTQIDIAQRAADRADALTTVDLEKTKQLINQIKQDIQRAKFLFPDQQKALQTQIRESESKITEREALIKPQAELFEASAAEKRARAKITESALNPTVAQKFSTALSEMGEQIADVTEIMEQKGLTKTVVRSENPSVVLERLKETITDVSVSTPFGKEHVLAAFQTAFGAEITKRVRASFEIDEQGKVVREEEATGVTVGRTARNVARVVMKATALARGAVGPTGLGALEGEQKLSPEEGESFLSLLKLMNIDVEKILGKTEEEE